MALSARRKRILIAEEIKEQMKKIALEEEENQEAEKSNHV